MSQDLLTLARFAEVLAHQEYFGQDAIAEVRERLGVEKVWEASFDHWTDKIEKDAVRKTPELSQEFAESFGAANADLEEKNPPIASLGELEESAPALSPVEAGEASGDELVVRPPPAEAREVVKSAVEPTPIGPPPAKTGPSPWAKASPSPPAVVAPPPPAASPPPAPAAKASIDQTALVSALVLEEPLPFTDGPAQVPEPGRASHSVVDIGMTAEVPAILSGNETLPFFQSSALGIDEEILEMLSIEQYASLCAELAAHPERQASVLLRYGVDDNTFDILESAWSEHLQGDSTALQRFNQLLDSYRAWLNSQG